MKQRATALVRGHAAHPDLDLPPEAFERFLALAGHGKTDRELEQLPIDDLYLACACAENVRGAAAAFEEKLGRIVRRAVARVLTTPAEREEAEQRTRFHLLVRSADGPPKIANYRGEGPLANWVSVAAIRLAVSMGRAATSEQQLRTKAVGEALGANPELLLMRQELRKELEVAVKEALAQLADRERTVLRLYLVSGMTLTSIGKTYGVTQQTASRWLIKARTDILAEVQRRFNQRLQLPRGELASIARLVASQLDISISRLLGGSDR